LKYSIVVVAALASCSKSADVTCGNGTVLKNGQCVVAQGSAQGSAQPQPAHSQEAGTRRASPAASSEPSKPAGAQWVFKTDTDKMRQKSVYFASLQSPDREMGITIRRGQPGAAFGLDVFFELAHGQFQCSYEGCSYAVKFDNGPIERWHMTNAEGLNGHVLFVSNAKGFVDRIRKARSLIIEIDRFQAGIAQTSFDVPPLEDWEPLKAMDEAARVAEAVDPNVVYCFDATGDTEPFTVCEQSLNRCENARTLDTRIGLSCGRCTRVSPPPCKPTGKKACNFRKTASGQSADMSDFVEKNNANADSPMTVHIEGNE
jgi:hypothetical protein